MCKLWGLAARRGVALAGVALMIGIGCAGCAAADSKSAIAATNSPPGEREQSEREPSNDELACTAAASPLSIVQNALTLGGAEISSQVAHRMLLSSERRIRDAAARASSELSVHLDDVASATAELARAEPSERTDDAERVSATQADLIEACRVVGVNIHLDAWAGG